MVWEARPSALHSTYIWAQLGILSHWRVSGSSLLLLPTWDDFYEHLKAHFTLSWFTWDYNSEPEHVFESASLLCGGWWWSHRVTFVVETLECADTDEMSDIIPGRSRSQLLLLSVKTRYRGNVSLVNFGGLKMRCRSLFHRCQMRLGERFIRDSSYHISSDIGEVSMNFAWDQSR